MKKNTIIILLSLTLFIILGFIFFSQKEALMGKFSTKFTKTTSISGTLKISQGDLYTKEETMTYGEEVVVLNFKLKPSTKAAVSELAFKMEYSGIHNMEMGYDLTGWKIYKVSGGSIDYSAQVGGDADVPVPPPLYVGKTVAFMTINMWDDSLGETYAYNLESEEEFVLVAKVEDDGVSNTNYLTLSSYGDFKWYATASDILKSTVSGWKTEYSGSAELTLN